MRWKGNLIRVFYMGGMNWKSNIFHEIWEELGKVI
jgi:hypothetical protein